MSRVLQKRLECNSHVQHQAQSLYQVKLGVKKKSYWKTLLYGLDVIREYTYGCGVKWPLHLLWQQNSSKRPHSSIQSCSRFIVTSSVLGLPLTASSRVFLLLGHEHTCSLSSFFFSEFSISDSFHSWKHDENSSAMTTSITTHPLYVTGSLALSHFFHWGPMGHCGLALTELAITPTAALHCSTLTGMSQSEMVH